MSININDKVALDIAVQTIKLIIGLSASMITFTVAFAQTGRLNPIPCVLKWSWGLLLISIFCGFFAIFRIVGELDAGRVAHIVYESQVSRFAEYQIGTFFISMLITVIWVLRRK